MESRRGRPPKSGNVNLTERLELRLTAEEKDAYAEAADAAGMERSDWIRAILNKAVKRPLKAPNRRT
jgi:uncharacterized protein (DUF1778 family)